MKPFFPGRSAWFSRAAKAGEPSSVCDEVFHARIGPFEVSALGTFFACSNDKIPCACYTRSQGFPHPHKLRIVKARKTVQLYTQAYLGVNLVDVLAARAGGTGEVSMCRVADGLQKKSRVHAMTFRLYTKTARPAFRAFLAVRAWLHTAKLIIKPRLVGIVDNILVQQNTGKLGEKVFKMAEMINLKAG